MRACAYTDLKKGLRPRVSSLLSFRSYDIALLRLGQSVTLNRYVKLGVLPQEGTILALRLKTMISPSPGSWSVQSSIQAELFGKAQCFSS